LSRLKDAVRRPIGEAIRDAVAEETRRALERRLFALIEKALASALADTKRG
jgi:hypothetical protein